MSSLPPERPEPGQPPRPAKPHEVVGAVVWSFLGIRKGKAMQRDAVTIKPLQVVVTGVVLAACLVALLLLLVRFILSHAGA